MRTALANNFVGENASEHILDEGRILGRPELILEAIKENVRILINVHLLGDVSWVAFVIFEGVAKRFRVIVFLVAVLKVHEHFLKLVKHILLVLSLPFRLFFSICNRVPEVGNHEQLLVETVHVADTP